MDDVVEMAKKDADEKNVDEKLVKWNDIFEELLIDAKTLIQDLSEGINYIAISAFIVIVIGGAALFVGLDRGGIKYVAAGFVIFCVCIFNGAMNLRKWHKLKKRYNRLQSLEKEMEHK